MATKIPKKYRKPIPEKTFQKKVLRRVPLDRERTFVEEAFRRDSEGRYAVREDISDAEKKRLAKVLKEIRKNRGFLKYGRLSVLLVLLVAALLFNYLFKDRLLEEAGERFLESSFQAQSDISGLHFKPVAGTITLDGVTIADRDAPMKNLISLGESELSIRSVELLKGNLVIRSLTAADIAFGTPRQESGALKGVEPRETGSSDLVGRGETAARDTLSALGLGSIAADPEAVVREFAGQLRSREVANELAAEAEATAEIWRARVAGTAESVESLRGEVAALQGQRVEDITTVQGALGALEEARGLRSRADALQADLRNSRAEIEREVESVTTGRRRLEAAIEEDFSLLRSQLPDLEVDPGEFATRTARLFLENFLGESYGRAISLIDRFESVRRDIPTPEEGPGRGGYDVPFPSVTYPRFYLQRAEASGGDGSTVIKATLEHLSSTPNLTGEPVGLSYTQEGGGRRLALTGAVDLRGESEERAEYTLSLAGLRPVLPAGLDALGFTSLEAGTAIDLTGVVSRNGALAGRIDLSATEPTLGLSDTAGATAQLLAEVIAEEPSVEAEIAYRVEEGRITEFSGTTSLATALSRRVEQLVAQVRERFESRIREELDTLLAEELGQYGEASTALADLSQRSLEELRQAETYREVATERQQAIEARLQDLRDQAEARGREEVEQRVEETRDQIEEEARDRLRLPFGN